MLSTVLDYKCVFEFLFILSDTDSAHTLVFVRLFHSVSESILCGGLVLSFLLPM